MDTCLLLILLLAAIPDSFSKVQELRVDVDFPGHDVQQIFSPDAYHCRLACTQHHSCFFFTFLRPDWNRDDRKFYCYLKNTNTGIPSHVTNLKGVTSGFSMSRQDYQKHSCLSATYQDVDFPGSDFRDFTFSSYVACQRACTSDPDCRFFSYTTESFPVAVKRNKCFLKYSWSVPVPPKIASYQGLVSGFSRSLQEANNDFNEECKGQILADREFPGNDFEKVPAASPQHCLFLCTKHPRCTHYSFSQLQMQCSLKSKPYVSEGESVGNQGVCSGFPTRDCKLSNVWNRRYQNIDFNGADSSQVFVNDTDTCENICTADPDCQFYTYGLPSSPNLLPAIRKKCHLKQIMTLPRPAKIRSVLGVVSGFSLNGCRDKSSEELRVDVNFPGDDVLQIYSPDAYHCQLACSQHHSCQFFTFLRPDWGLDSRKFYCYLKHTNSGKPTLISPLIGVTSGFSLSREEYKTRSCLSSIYQNMDFRGSDYHELPSSSYRECQKACTNDPDCQFFSFTTESYQVTGERKKCFLRYSWSVPVPPVINSLQGVVSGFSQSLWGTNSYFNEECKEEILSDREFPGNDFETVPAGSPQHCLFLCTKHPRCSHFSFSQIQMQCFLKSKMNISKDESVGKQGVHSGFPTRNCKLSNVWKRRYENINFSGADRGLHDVSNTDTCENICTADPDCQFYAYVLPSFPNLDMRNKCYLKRVMTLPMPVTVISVPGVISGFSPKSCDG